MVGTIEDLEKEIDQFQKNMMASGEVVKLLNQMVEGVKQQNDSFNTQAQSLLLKIENLPTVIERENETSNQKIKNDVSTEIGKTVQDFRTEQTRYLDSVDKFNTQVQSMLIKVENLPNTIERENEASNQKIKNDVSSELGKIIQDFKTEQARYLESAEKSQRAIEDAERKLDKSYRDFIDNIERMNISNLYDEYTQLKKTVNVRTTILMVISLVSVVVGIVGLII